MKEITLKSRAKINLTLDVTGKRDDGYHNVSMVMQTLSLYDNIYIKRIDKPIIKLKSNLTYLPCDERNIVYKAAQFMRDTFAFKDGLYIELDKRIPVAAGLAGGSGNCAATLVGINKLFGLKLSVNKLLDIGLKLGSDVPYCILRGTYLAEGSGERLTRLAPCPDMTVALIKPAFGVSTALAYKALDEAQIKKRPDKTAMINAIAEKDVDGIAANLCNVFEEAIIPQYGIIGEIKQKALSLGALNALMSGSGPTVYAIFKDRAQAENAARCISRDMNIKQVYVTDVYNPRRK